MNYYLHQSPFHQIHQKDWIPPLNFHILSLILHANAIFHAFFIRFYLLLFSFVNARSTDERNLMCLISLLALKKLKKKLNK